MQSGRFTYTEDPNYGPYLQSVNGLEGSTKNRTYWELLVKKANETIRPDAQNHCKERQNSLLHLILIAPQIPPIHSSRVCA
ncbi:hypothetical protein NQZ68_036211 [Dissostichus eleginoides]|nr:hypothetical protein NQZ68_036211 [Dissostichus eleginoides]